ncbi:MAG: DNA-binding response regulator [Lysobacterales bacterium]
MLPAKVLSTRVRNAGIVPVVTRKSRILIVEDEPAIRNGLVDVFVYHGFEVEAVGDGEQGLRLALGGRFDLLLLDVMLPGRNGFDILAAVRAQDREQAVILLTARSGDEDIVHGLALGADDYVAKPFSVTQLVLRVRAVLRRTQPSRESPQTLRVGACEVDLRNLRARTPAGEVAFTRREIEVLEYLAAHALRPVPREELLYKVWGYARHLEIETRTVDIHIARLRRKLEPDPGAPRYLVTVRGGGYRLLPEA